MNHDTSAEQQPPVGPAGPTFEPPVQPAVPSPVPGAGGPYSPPPSAYGASPALGPGAEAGREPFPSAPAQAQDHYWGPDGLVSTPALPPERVGRGAALALLAVPAGAVVTGIIWKLGFVASISSFLVAALAAILYVRGSGGRIRKGIGVVAAVIVLGVVASFFTAVAVDLWGGYPQLDPDTAATYPSRWGFVWTNLFYPPLLKDYTKYALMFGLFGLVGGFGSVARLLSVNKRL